MRKFGNIHLKDIGRLIKLPKWRYNHTVLAITWMGWICIYLARSVLPPIIPILKTEIGLNNAQAGLIETAYLIGYIIIKLPAGILANKIGSKKTLAISMIGYAFATLLSSFSTNFLQIFSLRFFVGFFQGIHLPVANALLSDRFGDKQNIAIGFNESGSNIGNTLAFPITVYILGRSSWRSAFMILSFPAFLLSLFTLIILKDEKFETYEESKNILDFNVLKRFFWVLAPYALAHATYNLLLRTLFTFTPSYLVEFQGMSIQAAGLFAMILPFTGIFAKISSGFTMNKLGSRISICGATILSALLLFMMGQIKNIIILSINLVFMGLTLYSFSPIIYSSTTMSLPSGLKSLGLGVITMFGNIIGALSTYVIGLLIDTVGYSHTFLYVTITVIASSFLTAIMMKNETNII